MVLLTRLDIVCDVDLYGSEIPVGILGTLAEEWTACRINNLGVPTFNNYRNFEENITQKQENA